MNSSAKDLLDRVASWPDVFYRIDDGEVIVIRIRHT
jgi:hypothetical protein